MNNETLEKNLNELGSNPSAKGVLGAIIYGVPSVMMVHKRLSEWDFNKFSDYFELGLLGAGATIGTLGAIMSYYGINKSITGKYPSNRLLNRVVYETSKISKYFR